MKYLLSVVLCVVSIGSFANTTYYSDGSFTQHDGHGNSYNSNGSWYTN